MDGYNGKSLKTTINVNIFKIEIFFRNAQNFRCKNIKRILCNANRGFCNI